MFGSKFTTVLYFFTFSSPTGKSVPPHSLMPEYYSRQERKRVPLPEKQRQGPSVPHTKFRLCLSLFTWQEKV